MEPKWSQHWRDFCI